MTSRQQALSLYRRLLTLHRYVSPSIKSLGIQYIKEEFRRHQHVDLARAQEFIQQWKVQMSVALLVIFACCMKPRFEVSEKLKSQQSIK